MSFYCIEQFSCLKKANTAIFYFPVVPHIAFKRYLLLGTVKDFIAFSVYRLVFILWRIAFIL